MTTVRRWLATILTVEASNNRTAQRVDLFMVTLISLNVVVFIFETVKGIRESYPPFFTWFERISVLVFTIEYLARLWVVVEQAEYRKPIIGRLRYALTPMALLDLLAIAPFFLPFTNIDLRALRIMRVFRLLRIAKLIRYSHALRTFGRVVRSCREQLLTLLFVLSVLMIMASTLMYLAERNAQPEVFANIPATMWWAIATLTTVGYGDVYPVTAVGRIIASAIAVLGIGVFALPTGILGAAFIDELSGDTNKSCPKCGHQLRK